MSIFVDVLTVAALLFGLFFMFIGAIGLWRLPDLYHRMHAGSKCITLGISGMLLAAVLHLSAAPDRSRPDDPDHPQADIDPRVTALGAVTKAMIVIIFQFVAAPVGAHMLARAAHMDGVRQWEGTLGDELEEDLPADGGEGK